MPIDSFKDGWITFLNNYSGYLGSSRDQSYIDSVAREIEKTEKELNTVIRGFHSSYESSGGYLAEVWHAGTYNIQSAVNKSEVRAYVPERIGGTAKTFAQPDIMTTDGRAYSLKYYTNGKASAKQQAMSYWERYNKEYKGSKSFEEYLQERGIDPDINKWESIYHDQSRLIPSDQVKDGIKLLEKKIANYTSKGLDTTGLKETLSLLTDRVTGNDGVSSIPLSKQDCIKLAELAVKGKVDLNELGISLVDLVGYEYIVNEALNAGITAALMSLALRMGPALCQTLMQVIQGQDVSLNDIKKLGITSASSAGFAFVNGAVSAGVVTAMKMGVFGKNLMNPNPGIVGLVSTIVVDIVFNSILLKIGKISSDDFHYRIVKDSVVVAGATGFGLMLAGLVSAGVVPFAFLLGSLAGAMLSSFVFDKAHEALLSLCWKNGLTLFGLVSLDYQIPENILRNIGIKGFDMDTFEVQSFNPKELPVKSFEFDSFETKSFELGIGLKMMSHSVIGAYRIGYSVK